MANGNGSFVEKLPNWLRWVLIPFGVIISFFLASLAIRFFLGFKECISAQEKILGLAGFNITFYYQQHLITSQ